jgi:hypothetical protein
LSEKKIPNVLEKARLALSEGKLVLSFHALEKMEQRKITYNDIKQVILFGKREVAKDDLRSSEQGIKLSWRYAIRGLSFDNDVEMRLILAIETEKVVVVTVIKLGKVQ